MRLAFDDSIDLTLPADPRLVRLARLLASGVASTVGFDRDDVEDCRIAVDELCGALIESGDGSPYALEFVVDDDELVVTGSGRRGQSTSADAARLALSRQILSVVVDDHSIDLDEDAVIVWLRKERSSNVEAAHG